MTALDPVIAPGTYKLSRAVTNPRPDRRANQHTFQVSRRGPEPRLRPAYEP